MDLLHPGLYISIVSFRIFSDVFIRKFRPKLISNISIGFVTENGYLPVLLEYFATLLTLKKTTTRRTPRRKIDFVVFVNCSWCITPRPNQNMKKKYNCCQNLLWGEKGPNCCLVIHKSCFQKKTWLFCLTSRSQRLEEEWRGAMVIMSTLCSSSLKSMQHFNRML